MGSKGRRRRAAVMITATAVTAALVPGVTLAAEGERLALDVGDQVLLEDRRVADTAVPDAALCELPGLCPRWTVEALGGGPGTRLVLAIDDSQSENVYDFLYELALAVYRDGAMVGYSDAAFESQVVVIDDPVPGDYEVVVVPERVVGPLYFDVYAALTTGPPAPTGPPHDLLPNLVAEPPTNLGIRATPGSLFAPFAWEWRGMQGPTSCYAQERVEQQAQRCLRFDQTIANLGPGPLELRLRLDGSGIMDQRVHRSDGAWHEAEVGAVEFHAAHGHFHYAGWAQARLHRSDSTGTKGELLRTGRKQGFCMADVRNSRFGQPTQTEPRYLSPGGCDGQEETTGSQVGISAGWADTYPWFLGDQFIEVSGVPDGWYILEFAVNQSADGVMETTRDDNAAGVLFRLDGDRVEVAGPVAG